MEYLTETSLEQDIRKSADGIFPNDETRAIGFLQTALMDLQSSVKSRTHDGVKYYPKEESIYFVENWVQAYLNNDASYLIAPRGLKRKIVDIEEFACSRKYLGLGGSIRYRILEELKRLNSTKGYVEVVLCLRGSTRIAMLDGTRPTIKELAETKERDDAFWVYSWKNGRMVPAQARFPHKTGKDVLWRVTFNDGTYVETNARHELVTVPGEKVPVRNLKSGDRIASFYAESRKMGEDGPVRNKFMPVSKGQHRGGNHKITSVECLGIEEDVYCMTVPDTGCFIIYTEGESKYQINSIVSSNSGGIGIGKNFFADIAILYDVYKLSCLESPQLEHGLAPGSSITFILQSITETLAKKIVFKSIRTRVLDSPYFMEHFKPDPKIRTELVFPGNISIGPVSASDTSALGANVFGGILDEISFHPKRAKSAMTALRGDAEYDKATILYQTMLRRMKSRFMMRQGLPGRIYLVASANYPQDFVSRKIEESREDKTIFVMHMPQWESHRLSDGTLDPERYSGNMFTIDLGSAQKPAQILSDGEDPESVENSINVPVEHKKDFVDNMDDALRDIAGMPRTKKTMFMPAEAILKQASRTYRNILGTGRQLFYEDKVDLSLYKDHQLKDLIDTRHINGSILKWKEYGFRRPPAFGVHIDAGLTSDFCGISVGRVMGLSSVNELRSYMPKTDSFVAYGGGIQAPIIFIDGVLGVEPPQGDEIDLDKVQGIIFTLIQMGVSIQWLSMDRFASPQMLQAIRKYRNVKTRLLSVDHPLTPYADYKITYRENRIIHPHHPILLRELKDLELDRKKNKVDHPVVNSEGKTGGKDLADAVCGVVNLLINLKETYSGRTTDEPINQYSLAGLPGPDLMVPEVPDEPEEEDPRSSRRSRRNPDRPRRGATRNERKTRFRHRLI